MLNKLRGLINRIRNLQYKPDTEKDATPLPPTPKLIPIDKRGRPLGKRYKPRPIPSHIVKLKPRTAHEKRLWQKHEKEEDE